MQYNIAMYIHVHLTLLQGLLAWHMLCVVYRAAHLLKVSVQFLTEASELPSSTVVKTKHIGQQVWEELMEILQGGGKYHHVWEEMYREEAPVYVQCFL